MGQRTRRWRVTALITSACPASTIVLTSAETEDVPSAVLRDCGAVAFVPKIELATTDLKTLFAGPGSQLCSGAARRVRSEGS
jgi:hypothetical protein